MKIAPPPAAASSFTSGTYPGRVLRFIGGFSRLESEKFLKPGKSPGMKDQAYVQYQIFGDDGETLIVGKCYNLSLHEKATLRHHFEAALGPINEAAGVDTSDILGRPVMVQVEAVKNGDFINHNIINVVAPPRGMTVPEATMPTLDFEVTKHCAIPDGVVPNWLQNEIKNSPEWQGESLADALLKANAVKSVNDDAAARRFNHQLL